METSGYIDISTLPDGTFFHVFNGRWDGYVTTENGDKVCYAGVSKTNPTEDYVRRFVINDGHTVDIDKIW